MSDIKLKKVTDYIWEIPKTGKMRVPGRIYATKEMLHHINKDDAPKQVANVAHLPGIINYSMAMPDIHWGYGFSIGGVAAFDMDEGVISPGGVGYDINCGVRLLRSGLIRNDIKNEVQHIIDSLFNHIPTGVGSKGELRVSASDLSNVMKKGARWAVENGYGDKEMLDKIEENGEMKGADPSVISDKAIKRGKPQLGTLGSGNHFVELQYVDEVYEPDVADRLGLFKDQITLTIHTGSRGFGYQVCDDYIHKMLRASEKYGIELPDRQLCCAPISSPEGREYYSAMVCAINYAFANRQVITHWAQEALEKALNIGPKDLQLNVVYEVAHNIAKFETHKINGKDRKVCVHRKGATRAFGPGSKHVPESYRDIGQPVLIPGDMGRCSYVLVGTEGAMDETFGSTCHGAGRMLSRKKSIKQAKGRAIYRELQDEGIFVRAAGKRTLAEEMPEAYKNVSNVVDAVAGAGISKKVVKLKPLGAIKG
ncbi:RNA-splicing ligase RtcB [candidate division KSB1 bacterium]|nr:RNA-splicing ligase RtcB [candidate division KSB1 bacterium]